MSARRPEAATDDYIARLRQENNELAAEQLQKERLVREGRLPVEILPEGARPLPPPPAWSKYILPPNKLFDFGPSESTPLDFLDDFPMPGSGACIIGARTGSGKTTSLVNFAAAYRRMKRKVTFITFEENAQEIVLSIALNFYAHAKTEPIPGWTRDMPGPGRRIYALNELENSLPALPADADPDFSDIFTRTKDFIARNGGPPPPLANAYNRIHEDICDGKLEIYDGLRDAEMLGDLIRETDSGVYVIDYLQAIPPPAWASRDSYKNTQATCSIVRELVNHNKKFLILGAQFNRTAGDESSRDAFDPRVDQFREAADIEQVATIAFGIGYEVGEDGRRRYFYKILKHRFAGRLVGAKLLSAGYFDFFYAQRGGRWTLPEHWPRPPRKLGAAQEIIMDALRQAGGSMTRGELVSAFEAAGKRRDNLNQSLRPLITARKIKAEGEQLALTE